MLDDRQMNTLMRNVGKNISELIEAMEWTQAKFAERTGISEPALSNYRKGDKTGGRLPPLDFLVSLCTMQEFKDKGLELTLDLLVSEKFNPKAIYVNDVYPACGINIGPGLLAAYYVGKPISEGLTEEKALIASILSEK